MCVPTGAHNTASVDYLVTQQQSVSSLVVLDWEAINSSSHLGCHLMVGTKANLKRWATLTSRSRRRALFTK